MTTESNPARSAIKDVALIVNVGSRSGARAARLAQPELERRGVRVKQHAEANGNFFVHTALVGYPAEANRKVPSWLKVMLGRAAYGYVLVSSLLRGKAFRAKVTTPTGGSWEGEAPLILVGNGRFHLPARVLLSPPDRGEEGLIVYGPRDSQPMTLLRLVFGLWIARRPQPSQLFSLSTKEATMYAEPPQRTDLDGEYSSPTPTTLRLAPGALRVLVPAGTSNE